MKLAVMQPYFCPYVGYFQLIAAVDIFVIYDNIKYTKKGWINRNRILQNGKEVLVSLPLKNASDCAHVVERELAVDFQRSTLLNRFREAYRSAPYFKQTFPFLERLVTYADPNLFRFLHQSIVQTCEFLGISTEVMVSSDIAIDHDLKNQDKVVALCQALGADTYVNAIGGMELYSQAAFKENGIGLKFIRSGPFEYQQFGGAFIPWLSIIDVMMFNPLDVIRHCISSNYELI